MSAKKIYVKFRLRKFADLVMPASCRVSRDKHLLEGDKKRKDATEEKLESTADSPPAKPMDADFELVTANFSSANAKFHRLVPFVMGVVPILSFHEMDEKVRSHVKKWGKLIEASQDHELYEVPDGQMAEISRRLELFRLTAEGILDLPSMFLVGLVASYETFFSDLVRAILVTRPEIISSSERNISFRDLVEIGSIAAARDRIVDREVDDVMRSSISDQLAWIEQKLGIKIRDGNELWPKMIELSERRNLIIHTSAVVSQQYLQNCQKAGCDIADVKLGDRLDVKPSYLDRGIALVFEFGIKLSQVVWRKMMPRNLDDAVDALNQVAFDLIVARRFDLAARILKFGLEEMKKQGKESARKQMVVNYANAVRLGGDVNAALEILEKEDWSATSDKYRICVLAVKGEVDAVVKMMGSVAGERLIKAAQFREWPVFETVRSEAAFASEFERVFGEKLFGQSEPIVAPDLAEIDGQEIGG